MQRSKEESRTEPLDQKKAQHFSFSLAMIPGVIRVLDIVSIAVPGFLLYFLVSSYNPYSIEYYTTAIVFVSFASSFFLKGGGLYEIQAIMRPVGSSDVLLLSVIAALLLYLALAFALRASELYSHTWLYSFGVCSFLSILVVRFAAYRVLRILSQRHLIDRRVVILGTGTQGRELLRRIGEVRPFFTSIEGVYGTKHEGSDNEVEGIPYLGNTEDLVKGARQAAFEDVVVALPWNADQEVIEAVETLKELPINVYISSDLVGYRLAFRPALGTFQELSMFEVLQRPISGWSSLLKFLEDYIIGALVLLLLSPFFLFVALAIKIDSPGPVFFKQPRFGFNNKRFNIYKFRSMYYQEVPEDRVTQATKEDPRITRVGRFIRKTSIDELPQLFNVLNGTMSLVGPRPHAVSHNEDFAKRVRGYFGRHKVKPGITGLAQVKGLRGETDTLEKITARTKHDIYYAENWSLLFDLRILVKTAFVVVFQRNAY